MEGGKDEKSGQIVGSALNYGEVVTVGSLKEMLKESDEVLVKMFEKRDQALEKMFEKRDQALEKMLEAKFLKRDLVLDEKLEKRDQELEKMIEAKFLKRDQMLDEKLEKRDQELEKIIEAKFSKMERNLTSDFDDLKKDFKRAEQTISLDVDSRWKTMLKTNKAQAAELEAKFLFGSLACRPDKIENDFGDAAFDGLSPAMTRYLKKERESANLLREALSQISERVNQMPAITRQARAQELLDEQARRQTLDLELLHRLSGLEECVKKLATSCQVGTGEQMKLR